MGLSGAVPLTSKSGYSRVALSSNSVGSLVAFGLSLLVAPLLVASPLQQAYGTHNSHLVLHAVVHVLVNKAVLPDHQTYVSKKNLPTTSAVSTASELSLIVMKRDCGYCKMTKGI